MTVVDPKRNCACSTYPRVGDGVLGQSHTLTEVQDLLQQVQQLLVTV